MLRPSRLAVLLAAVLVTLFGAVVPAHAVSVQLDHGHVDGVWVKLVNGNLQVLINDHTSGFGEQDPANVGLVAKPAAEQVVPASPNPACQGTLGNPVWILPQTENDLQNGLLWLGWSAQSISSGALVGNQVTLKLTAARPATGSGVFCGFTKGVGTTTRIFDSSDGFTSADSVAIPAGSTGHRHINWAFTKADVWTLVFEVTGTPTGAAPQTITKTYTFCVDVPCP